ncbi:hypothetical protein ABW19_dt0207263 [Dactylella cylindrospora]|nr:hypothetical protein ABW19_dt0207263 [Dactylella cylindrospora]
MSPTDRLSTLDDDTTPTKTTTTSVNLTDPPVPQPGALPTPTTSVNKTSQGPSVPQPATAPSLPSATSAAAAASTSLPAPTFTMPPPVQTTYGPPEVTMRGQPISGYTSTASSTSYQNYPGAVRRSSEVAPIPGGYQQRENTDRMFPGSEEEKREPGILGKISQAVDSLNEWMVGGKGGTSGI